MGIYAETVKSWVLHGLYHQNSGEFGFSQLELMMFTMNDWEFDHPKTSETVTFSPLQTQWILKISENEDGTKIWPSNLGVDFLLTSCWSQNMTAAACYEKCIPVARSVLSGITSSKRHLATDLVHRNLHRSQLPAAHGVIFVGNWMRSIDGLGPMNPRFSTIHQCNESGSKSKQQQVNASSKIRIKVISHKQIKIRVRIKPNWKSESESIQIQSR